MRTGSARVLEDPAAALPTGTDKRTQVRAMFDAIAPRYDLVNRLMTGGLDQRWRRRTLEALALPSGSRLVDLGSGTGDLVRLAHRAGHQVVAVDLSWQMLATGRARHPFAAAQADAEALPIADGSLDGVVSGFALRNLRDLGASLAEAARVLRPGGRVALLEVAAPKPGPLRYGFSLWFDHAVPRIGGLLSDRAAYRYLPRSVAYLPDEATLRRLLLERGFATVGRRLLHGGLAQLITATPNGLAGQDRVAMSPLRARSRPVRAAADLDPLDLLGPDAALFANDELALVGRGRAVVIELAGGLAADVDTPTQRAFASIDVDDPLSRPGSGPLAMGALPFDRREGGRLVVPEILFGRDSAGAWVTVVGPDPELPDSPDAAWVRDRFAPVPVPSAPVDLDAVRVHAEPSPHTYVDAVAEAVRAITDGRLAKVVLARSLRLETATVPPAADVVRRLHRAEPSCTLFSQPVPSGRFVGASPELLISRRDRRVRSMPLAGSVRLGGVTAADSEALGRLRRSAKDHQEHQLVVEQIAGVLSRVSASLVVPEAPSVVALRAIAHLGTLLEGELRHPVSVLAILAALHPSAAVGGWPDEPAEALIAASEPVPRDCWAGPVGWVDRAGDGDWFIGLRSALLEHRSVRLWAGAGVVAGSDPKSELDETTFKLRPVLEAVIPGAGELLSS